MGRIKQRSHLWGLSEDDLIAIGINPPQPRVFGHNDDRSLVPTVVIPFHTRPRVYAPVEQSAVLGSPVGQSPASNRGEVDYMLLDSPVTSPLSHVRTPSSHGESPISNPTDMVPPRKPNSTPASLATKGVMMSTAYSLSSDDDLYDISNNEESRHRLRVGMPGTTSKSSSETGSSSLSETRSYHPPPMEEPPTRRPNAVNYSLGLPVVSPNLSRSDDSSDPNLRLLASSSVSKPVDYMLVSPDLSPRSSIDPVSPTELRLVKDEGAGEVHIRPDENSMNYVLNSRNISLNPSSSHVGGPKPGEIAIDSQMNENSSRPAPAQLKILPAPSHCEASGPSIASTKRPYQPRTIEWRAYDPLIIQLRKRGLPFSVIAKLVSTKYPKLAGLSTNFTGARYYRLKRALDDDSIRVALHMEGEAEVDGDFDHEAECHTEDGVKSGDGNDDKDNDLPVHCTAEIAILVEDMVNDKEQCLSATAASNTITAQDEVDRVVEVGGQSYDGASPSKAINVEEDRQTSIVNRSSHTSLIHEFLTLEKRNAYIASALRNQNRHRDRTPGMLPRMPGLQPGPPGMVSQSEHPSTSTAILRKPSPPPIEPDVEDEVVAAGMVHASSCQEGTQPQETDNMATLSCFQNFKFPSLKPDSCSTSTPQDYQSLQFPSRQLADTAAISDHQRPKPPPKRLPNTTSFLDSLNSRLPPLPQLPTAVTAPPLLSQGLQVLPKTQATKAIASGSRSQRDSSTNPEAIANTPFDRNLQPAKSGEVDGVATAPPCSQLAAVPENRPTLNATQQDVRSDNSGALAIIAPQPNMTPEVHESDEVVASKSQSLPDALFPREIRHPTKNTSDTTVVSAKGQGLHGTQSKLPNMTNSTSNPIHRYGGGDDTLSTEHYAPTRNTTEETRPRPPKISIGLVVQDTIICAEEYFDGSLTGVWLEKKILVFRLPREILLSFRHTLPSRTRTFKEWQKLIENDIPNATIAPRRSLKAKSRLPRKTFSAMPPFGLKSALTATKRRKTNEGTVRWLSISPDFVESRDLLAVGSGGEQRLVENGPTPSAPLKRKASSSLKIPLRDSGEREAERYISPTRKAPDTGSRNDDCDTELIRKNARLMSTYSGSSFTPSGKPMQPARPLLHSHPPIEKKSHRYENDILKANPSDPGGATYICTICKKEFQSSFDQKAHELIHSWPWKCPEPECQYHDVGLRTREDRDRHYNEVHVLSPKTHKCKFPPCTYQSTREVDWKEHMESVHKIQHIRTKGEKKSKADIHASNATANLILGGRKYAWMNSTPTTQSSETVVKQVSFAVPSQTSGPPKTSFVGPSLSAASRPMNPAAAKRESGMTLPSHSVAPQTQLGHKKEGAMSNSTIGKITRPSPKPKHPNPNRLMNPPSSRGNSGISGARASLIIKSQLGPDKLRLPARPPTENRIQTTGLPAVPVHVAPKDVAARNGDTDSPMSQPSSIVESSLLPFKSRNGDGAARQNGPLLTTSDPIHASEPESPTTSSSDSPSVNTSDVFALLEFARWEARRSA